MRKAVKYIIGKTYRPLLAGYLSKTRTYRHKKLTLSIKQGVFHPGLFFSTGLLLQYLKEKEVSDKKFLELGAGSGLIAMEMSGRNAMVTASDISKVAIENIRENAARNNLILEVIHSDLFDNLQGKLFDIIVINPPYYAGDPSNESEHAWYAGKNFDYFRKMFTQLSSHIHSQSEVYMILSEDCSIDKIKKIAESANMKMTEVYRKRIWWEINYIFVIT